jgi:hypothetical protein
VRFIEPLRLLCACAIAWQLGGCASPLPSAAPVAQNAPIASSTPSLRAPAGAAPRNWEEFKHQAALRLVAANPHSTYDGPVPEPLLAIPVLEIELEANGAVRSIKVLRVPTQATDTVQLAIDAVHRAAPFGDVSQLPRPWKYVEVFLFDEQRRFKPRTLDL